MRQFWLNTIITGCFFLVLSGCQEPAKTENNSAKSIHKTSGQSEPNKPATITFKQTEVNFGQVGQGTNCTKELKFANTGQGILKITGIGQCCGIFAKTDKEQYAPGETGILKIKFQAPRAVGKYDRQPIVLSNDPLNPELALNLIIEVVQKVVWEPEEIKLLLNKENAACPKVTIKSVDKKKFAITEIKSTGNCVTADYNPAVKKAEHVLDLKVDMDKLPEKRYGEINVSMNHPEGNNATIFFNVVPKYTISPNSASFLIDRENKTQTKLVKIINNYEADIEIESTSSREKTVKLIDERKVKNYYELTLEITPPVNAGDSYSFTDIFYISLKSGEQLEIPCKAYYID
jgi:hypothetical protein